MNEQRTRTDFHPTVVQLMEAMIGMSSSAQEARKFLLLEQLDNMPQHLLEVEKHCRNARTAIATLQNL